MTTLGTPCRQLSRMEEARRQTQRQLDMIERQVTRRMTALIPDLLPRRTHYRRGRAPDPETFLRRYRFNLAAITAEYQPEIDALSRKLARQDQAIVALRRRDEPARHAASALPVHAFAPICHGASNGGCANG